MQKGVKMQRDWTDRCVSERRKRDCSHDWRQQQWTLTTAMECHSSIQRYINSSSVTKRYIHLVGMKPQRRQALYKFSSAAKRYTNLVGMLPQRGQEIYKFSSAGSIKVPRESTHSRTTRFGRSNSTTMRDDKYQLVHLISIKTPRQQREKISQRWQ